jgi:hypothetical protein
MIVIEPVRDKIVLITTPQCSLEQADFEMFASEIFPGWKRYGALTAQRKFVSGHHRQIDLIAVVVLLVIIPAVGRYFVRSEICPCAFQQRALTLSCLETGRP